MWVPVIYSLWHVQYKDIFLINRIQDSFFCDLVYGGTDPCSLVDQRGSANKKRRSSEGARWKEWGIQETYTFLPSQEAIKQLSMWAISIVPTIWWQISEKLALTNYKLIGFDRRSNVLTPSIQLCILLCDWGFILLASRLIFVSTNSSLLYFRLLSTLWLVFPLTLKMALQLIVLVIAN